MRVFTPMEMAEHTGSKYLGILVAARFARELNALPTDTVPGRIGKKLTTRALETMSDGAIDFELVKRRRHAGE